MGAYFQVNDSPNVVDKGIYDLPTNPESTFYVPFFFDKVDDSLAVDPTDTHWNYYYNVVNTTGTVQTLNTTVYSTTRLPYLIRTLNR